MPLLRKRSMPAKQFFRISALLVAAFSFVAIPVFAQQEQIAGLAARTADAISKAHAKSIVVADFWSPQNKLTKLGQALADQFSAELLGLGKFKVLDRRCLHDVIEQNGLSPLALRDIDIAEWMAHESRAAVIILGNLESANAQYKLAIGIYTVPKGKNLNNFGITMPAGPNWESLFQTPMLGFASGPHEAGKDGYTTPRCVYCSNPTYSGAAFHEKLQGVVVLDAIIGPDGKAHDIIVAKKMGSGLDESAVKAAQSWRFQPAVGPDGKPAAVRMLFEMEFHLY